MTTDRVEIHIPPVTSLTGLSVKHPCVMRDGHDAADS